MTREEALSYAKAELKAAYNRAEKIGHKGKTRYIVVLEMAIKALEQEPTTKNDLGVDCISRQAVLDLINADWKYENLEIEINNLPSVTPQEPRKGHWIMTHDYFTGAYENIDYVKCSCCGEDSLEYGNYCPNCGAEMNEVEE